MSAYWHSAPGAVCGWATRCSTRLNTSAAITYCIVLDTWVKKMQCFPTKCTCLSYNCCVSAKVVCLDCSLLFLHQFRQLQKLRRHETDDEQLHVSGRTYYRRPCSFWSFSPLFIPVVLTFFSSIVLHQVVYLCSCDVLPPEPATNVAAVVAAVQSRSCWWTVVGGVCVQNYKFILNYLELGHYIWPCL